jgi:hypothetical protein
MFALILGIPATVYLASRPGMHAGKGAAVNLTVVGGAELIGSQVVQKLTAAGHRAVPTAPSTGVDLSTGQGLDQALEGAEVVTPYSIVRATQFFEFIDTVVSGTSDDTTGGIRSIAGPDVFPLDELGRLTLTAELDDRTVITDDKAGMFAPVTGDVLTAGPGAPLAPTHYRDWLQAAR